MFFQINGFDYDDIKYFNPIEFDKIENKSFEGNEIIIGSYTAEKLGLDIGSEFEISINNKSYCFSVYGIAKKMGLFAFDGQRYSAIVPISTLRELMELSEESASELYVVLKSGADKEDLLNEDIDYKNLLVISPDGGAFDRARYYANLLGNLNRTEEAIEQYKQYLTAFPTKM